MSILTYFIFNVKCHTLLRPTFIIRQGTAFTNNLNMLFKKQPTQEEIDQASLKVIYDCFHRDSENKLLPHIASIVSVMVASVLQDPNAFPQGNNNDCNRKWVRDVLEIINPKIIKKLPAEYLDASISTHENESLINQNDLTNQQNPENKSQFTPIQSIKQFILS